MLAALEALIFFSLLLLITCFFKKLLHVLNCFCMFTCWLNSRHSHADVVQLCPVRRRHVWTVMQSRHESLAELRSGTSLGHFVVFLEKFMNGICGLAREGWEAYINRPAGGGGGWGSQRAVCPQTSPSTCAQKCQSSGICN